MGEETHKLSPVMKSQLSVSSPVDRGPLILQYPITGESFILQPMKGQVQPFHGASRPVEVHVKTARYVHESWPFSFLRWVWTGIWRSYGFQMGIEMCPVFIQGNTLWIAHCFFPKRPHWWLLRSVWILRLKQLSKVNIATVFAPCPLTSQQCAPWGLSFHHLAAVSVTPFFIFKQVFGCQAGKRTRFWLPGSTVKLWCQWRHLYHIQQLYSEVNHLQHVLLRPSPECGLRK